MVEQISLLQNQKLAPSAKQTQRLMLTREMQQGIHFLQLPLMELNLAIEKELEQNPVLEWEENDGELENSQSKETFEEEMNFDEHKFDILKQLDEEFKDLYNGSSEFIPKLNSEEEKKRGYLESSIEDLPSLSDHLMQQAREAFSHPSDLPIAEILIGYLDDAGFIKTPLEDISKSFNVPKESLRKVLAVMQTFDPIGIFSESVQQLLLTQLRQKGKQDSLSYRLLENHFDDLLHSRLTTIQKKLKMPVDKIQEAIQKEISHLDLHPGAGFTKRESPTVIPDVKLSLEGEKIIAEVQDKEIKPIRLNRKYLQMLNDENLPQESKEFIKSKILSAKWLMRNIEQRGSTLLKVADSIAHKQREFFLDPAGLIRPLIMRQLADELGVHESTIARAVSNKYLESPRGIFPLRYFFSNAFVNDEGEDISSTTVKELLAELIKNENPKKPLSDAALSKMLGERGIPCARRTIAKYRGILELGNAQQRRKY